MVKSYRGVEQKEEKKLKPKKLVADYMATKLISFSPELSIYEAMQSLLKHKISGALVVGKDNELLGVVSEGDCLKEIVKGRYENEINQPGTVGDHMTISVTTIEAEMGILEAAHFFLERKFRRFPVMKNGKLIGLITQTDVMRAMNDF
jgi:CBS domain-containing protein